MLFMFSEKLLIVNYEELQLVIPFLILKLFAASKLIYPYLLLKVYQLENTDNLLTDTHKIISYINYLANTSFMIAHISNTVSTHIHAYSFLR